MRRKEVSMESREERFYIELVDKMLSVCLLAQEVDAIDEHLDDILDESLNVIFILRDKGEAKI
jgi:hypothetical protein